MRPHTTRHVETNAASGYYAALVRIKRSDPADRKAISSVGVRHGVSGSGNAWKRGNVL